MNNNNSNSNAINAINRDGLNSVHELISTYGIETMPQVTEILSNEAMGIDRRVFDRIDANL